MKRGEIWTVAGAPGYGGKPRPAVILQSDVLAGGNSVITCGLTSQTEHGYQFRPAVQPSPLNGLDLPSRIMTEKLAAIPRNKLGKRIGSLSGAEMAQVEQALLLVLGFEG